MTNRQLKAAFKTSRVTNHLKHEIMLDQHGSTLVNSSHFTCLLFTMISRYTTARSATAWGASWRHQRLELLASFACMAVAVCGSQWHYNSPVKAFHISSDFHIYDLGWYFFTCHIEMWWNPNDFEAFQIWSDKKLPIFTKRHSIPASWVMFSRRCPLHLGQLFRVLLEFRSPQSAKNLEMSAGTNWRSCRNLPVHSRMHACLLSYIYIHTGYYGIIQVDCH